ncbi:DEAD/DEAH box helicase [Fimbriiglobus ruber]|uniref:DNA/RNA helicase n=1 Tax=Fimbriiglobus ruber TaxID=1908690 RepID=A0A225DWC6_9BACT|nr:DEAD/DEAH box helicase [Fimbriiglobus ruber]OWK45830.1 DNA/RNA helicase [Fimbriiglobus ruber]
MLHLRDYQQSAAAAVRAEWERVQSTAVVMATGTGKTELYLDLAVSDPGRALVLAHRDYLLDQPIARLAALGFKDVAVEKAKATSEGGLWQAKVVFASVQTLSKPDRLARFDPTQFSVLIVDEGHRAVARSYRTVIDHFRKNPRLRVLVVTATPKRKDGVALAAVCDSVAYTYGPRQAAADGWIVPLRFFRREVDGLDFSHVALRGTDLDADHVEQLLLEEKPLHTVCASLAEDRGPTIVFCPGVAVARAYSALMNQRYRPGRSAVLWADSSDEERALVAQRLAADETEYVFNVDLFTEGYDVPELARVVWAAPTASLVRYTQGVGRVFRPHASLRGQLASDQSADDRRQLIAASPKPFGAVVTYYPQNCRHQLCDPTDILGGDDLAPGVRAAVRQVQETTAAQPGGSDPEADLDTAAAFVELRALLDRRRQSIRATATVTDVEYDGITGRPIRAVGDTAEGASAAARSVSADWPPGDPASVKQLTWLRWHGLPDAFDLGLTKFRAVVLRDLIEAGVNPITALHYPKWQALAVRESYRVGREVDA